MRLLVPLFAWDWNDWRGNISWVKCRVSHLVSDWSYQVQGVSCCRWLIPSGAGCLILWVIDPIMCRVCQSVSYRSHKVQGVASCMWLITGCRVSHPVSYSAHQLQGVQSCKWLILTNVECLILWMIDPIRCRVSHPVGDWSHQVEGVSSCMWSWGAGCLILSVTGPIRHRVSYPMSHLSHRRSCTQICHRITQFNTNNLGWPRIVTKPSMWDEPH